MSKPTLSVIATFDFDGTLTTKDSLWDFLLYSFGLIRLFFHLIKQSPALFLYIIGRVSNEYAKEKLLGSFLKNMPEEQFAILTRKYAEQRLPQIIRPEALERLKWHQQQGHTVIIISASLTQWIEPWAIRQGISRIIATQVEIKNGTLTGKLKSRNCFGPEKVARLLREFPKREAYALYAYGDGKSDREILAFADHSFYRRFS